MTAAVSKGAWTVTFYVDNLRDEYAVTGVRPTSTAHVSRHGPRSSARDRTILAVKEIGRRRWKKTSGYHGQARVENAFFRYTSIIGDSLRACSRRCCMNTLWGWGGLARTSRDTPQEPHYRDAVEGSSQV